MDTPFVTKERNVANYRAWGTPKEKGARRQRRFYRTSYVTVGKAVSGLTNSLTRTDGAATYYTKGQTYDPFGEMTQESNTDAGGVSHVIMYQYDKNGNRTQRHETQAGAALTEDDAEQVLAQLWPAMRWD